MASEYPDRKSIAEIESTIGSIKKMLMVSAIFAAVGYLLVGAAIFFELTSFHPLLENYFTQFPDTSLAGGSGGTRGAAVNSALAEIHKWPSTLLWLKLGGVGHIPLGIFISLAAIVRALSIMPHRLSYEMERAQE
ncbi:hypothetical protein KM295_11975 [Natronomonas sp. F2-12]|uniref:Uncharacterized protein n=1 Tax=Natronomonas aquatica TaxID=2841590 RepID=A0A9R1CUV1_9EURY|nr:hypothetical protein [Natronomonas aquatica]MCQ4334182.1 hypothetical protein [Natronomonas aquatica]